MSGPMTPLPLQDFTVCVTKTLPPPPPTEFLNSKHCILDIQNELRMFFQRDGCMPKDYVYKYAYHRCSTFHSPHYYCNEMVKDEVNRAFRKHGGNNSHKILLRIYH
jgi:hypothetical protein